MNTILIFSFLMTLQLSSFGQNKPAPTISPAKSTALPSNAQPKKPNSPFNSYEAASTHLIRTVKDFVLQDENPKENALNEIKNQIKAITVNPNVSIKEGSSSLANNNYVFGLDFELNHNQRLLFYELLLTSDLVLKSNTVSDYFFLRYVDEAAIYGDFNLFPKMEKINRLVPLLNTKRKFFFKVAMAEQLFGNKNDFSFWAEKLFFIDQPRAFMGDLLHITKLINEKKFPECAHYRKEKNESIFLNTARSFCNSLASPQNKFEIDRDYKTLTGFMQVDFYEYALHVTPQDFLISNPDFLKEGFGLTPDRRVIVKLFYCLYTRKILGENNKLSIECRRKMDLILKIKKSSLISPMTKFLVELYETNLDTIDVNSLKNKNYFQENKDNRFFKLLEKKFIK